MDVMDVVTMNFFIPPENSPVQDIKREGWIISVREIIHRIDADACIAPYCLVAGGNSSVLGLVLANLHPVGVDWAIIAAKGTD